MARRARSLDGVSEEPLNTGSPILKEHQRCPACYSDDDDAGSLSDLSPASLKAGLQLQTGDNYFANLRYSN